MDHGAAGEIERSHFKEVSGIVENRVEIRLRGRLAASSGIGKGLRGSPIASDPPSTTPWRWGNK